MTSGDNAVVPVRRRLQATRRRGDAIFRNVSLGAGLFVLAVLVAIAVFLVVRALPAFRRDTASFWTTLTWDPEATKPRFGVAALAFGTALSSLMAIVMAFPVALCVALFITEFAPKRVSRLLGYVTDMLAAVPSVIYGLWGLYWLVPHLTGLQSGLHRTLGWLPLFAAPNGVPSPSRSLFATSVVLAIMILPIVSALARETVLQVDPALREAALALGATRWEMVRTAVIPSSRAGLTGGVILGLGRALGETIAVALVLGIGFHISWNVLIPGQHNTIAAQIANNFGEAGSTGRAALIAAGVVLFAMTMVVSLFARWIIYRSAKVARAGVA